MNKKLISAFLALVMLFGMIPTAVYGAGASYDKPNSFLGRYSVTENGVTRTYDTDLHVSQLTTNEIAPGIKGTDVCYYDLNNNEQIAGYMTTVDLSHGNVKIKATYKGFYNGTDSSKWNVDKWGMQTISDQAAAYEASTGEKVVAATNGDYFNMQTGQPLGVLVMNGVNCNPDRTAAEPYFAILKDGTAVIRDKGTPIDDVEEAISSPFYLVKNGVNVVGSSTELIPCNSIGVDNNGNVITFLADGRQEPYSRGMSQFELAEFWIALGVENVLYLDGGGSATSLSTAADGKNLTLRNSPSDGYERTVSSGLLFISTAPEYTGEFHHASIYTAEDSYAPGATVEFKANCIDTTGHSMSADTEWELDATSAGLGSIDKSTGVFFSNGTPGTVTVNLILNGAAIASKTVTINGSDNFDNYTGFISSEAGKKYMVNGNVVTGWFAIGKEMYHSGNDGIVHKTSTKDTRTCLQNGSIQGSCECGEKYYGQALWSLGHSWDENYVCTRCGEQGVDINCVTAPSPKFYTYQGKAVTPNVNYLTYEGRTLNISSSRKGTDGYASFYNNDSVGIAQITIEGRGNFYGTMYLDFYILPGPIASMYCENVTDNSATLRWDEACGATKYIVEQNVNGSWEIIARVDNTRYELRDLSPNTSYEYRVSWEAKLDKTYRTSTNSRPTVSFTTKPSASDIFCTLENGQTVKASHVGEDNYIFLPSGTDISRLLFSSSDKAVVTIAGDKGSAKIDTVLDLNSISSKADGCYSVSVSAVGYSYSAKIMVSDSIPSLFLTSSDAENEGRSYVDSKKGNSTTGSMFLCGADGKTVIYDGELTQIKSRGNSSFVYSPKKPYQIKLGSKADILGNGEKGKTWVLLSNYMDATSIRDKLFKDLASEMGMLGTPDCNWVDLYYDGEYRGTYLISEKASIGKTTLNITDMEDAYSEINENYGDNAVVNTAKNAYGNEFFYTKGLNEPEDITGGYLLEVNGNRGIDEASGFKTSKGFDVNVKSPEYAGKSAMIYISEYFQAFEDAVYAQDAEGNYTGYNAETGKYFYEYCDMDSLVKMYLIQSIAANPDAFYASLYFYKDAGEIMHIGPLWDMDLSLGAGMESDIIARNNYINAFRYLAQALIQIPEFKNAVMEYHNSSFNAYIQELIDNGIDKYVDTVESSISMNHVIWPYVRSGNPNSPTHFYDNSVTYGSIVTNTKIWLTNRLAYLTEVANHEHRYNEKVTAPTCTEKGYATYTCSICGANHIGGYAEALGHDFGEWKVTTAPTCTEKGVETRCCSRCDATETRDVEVLDHEYKAVVTAPTCEEKGCTTHTCTLCGDSYVDSYVDALGHDFGEWKVTTAPTCTEKGVETHSCSRCNAAETRAVAALGHEYKSGKCVRCGEMNNPFTDIGGLKQEMQDAILWAYYHEPEQITSGFTATEFRPNNDCTRGQVVTFLWRAAGCPEPESKECTFKDVHSTLANGKDNPYYEAILWATENGITTGFNDGTFRPDDTVTRAQFVTFLWRYEGKPETTGRIDGFTDAASIAEPYREAVAWGVENGVIAGYEDSTFRPNNACARWAVAVLLQRALDVAEE